jgi:hypothetical protein
MVQYLIKHRDNCFMFACRAVKSACVWSFLQNSNAMYARIWLEVHVTTQTFTCKGPEKQKFTFLQRRNRKCRLFTDPKPLDNSLMLHFQNNRIPPLLYAKFHHLNRNNTALVRTRTSSQIVAFLRSSMKWFGTLYNKDNHTCWPITICRIWMVLTMVYNTQNH